MNTENNHWDIAERNFSLILAKENIETTSLFSAILSSAFLIFRNEQKRRQQSFCEKSLAYLEKIGKNEANDFYQFNDIRYSKSTPILRNGDSRSDNIPMFSICAESEAEYKTNLTKEENERIINGILTGNQKTFNEIYEFELPKVIRYIKRNSGDVDQANDIFQDAIVILVEKVQRKELSLTCSIKAYLFSISQHLWMEQLRLLKKSVPLNNDLNRVESDVSIVSIDPIPDIYDEVNKAIDKMGNSGKKLLECFYYKKMSCEEIAKLMGYSGVASVRNQKYKYLEQIRRAVKLELHTD